MGSRLNQKENYIVEPELKRNILFTGKDVIIYAKTSLPVCGIVLLFTITLPIVAILEL